MEFHELAMQTLYSEAVEEASTQRTIQLDSPGSPFNRVISGNEYVYWRFYRGGKRLEESLGRAGTPETEEKLAQKHHTQRELVSLARKAQLLRAAKFAAADNNAAITLASMYNAGLFVHGAVLVGSHAYGALLNNLGIRPVRNYQTNDVDVGTTGKIAVAIPGDRSFLDVLRDSGLRFLEVPELDPRKAATSFKVAGQQLKVDLLVPGTMAYESHRLPGLKANATGLPFFGYLLSRTVAASVIGKDHVIPLTVPHPAYFALHKLIVSTLRIDTRAEKSQKDLQQAMVLLEAMLQLYPAEVDEAERALADDARVRVGQAATRALTVARHPASEQLADYLENLSGFH